MTRKAEKSGGSVQYYKLPVPFPANLPEPYTCECEDIIEALGMTFSEANQFKAIWRSCAARQIGRFKEGMDEDGIYDAEKMVYYAGRTLAVRKNQKAQRLQSIAKARRRKPKEQLLFDKPVELADN